jgi:uncharacterized damage-inducible protein DinB
MTVRDLERRFDYSHWANKKLFAVIEQLTPEQFTQNVAGSYGSVRHTMVHMLSAEWGWFDRCGLAGPPRGPALKAEDFPTRQSIVDTWAMVERKAREFLSNLKDEDLARVAEFELPKGQTHARRVGELLEHAANHGAHHRGQLALLLRVLGHSPGNVDLLFYDAEPQRVSAW